MRANQKGFGLILMIILIAISMVMVGSIVSFMASASNLSIVRINKVRSYYLALGGIMRTLHSWTISYTNLLDDMTGSYQDYRWTGNGSAEIADTGFNKSDFAYFMMDAPNFNAQWWPLTSPIFPANNLYPAFPRTPPNAFCTSNQVVSGGNNYDYRLYGWTLQNIHSSADITLAGATIRWSPAGDSGLRVSKIRLNDDQVFSSSARNGEDFNLTGNSANRTLTPGPLGRKSGPCTYIQWNGAVPDPIRVTVQLRFDDGSTTHEALFWDGQLAGQGRPHIHTFSVTSAGQVNQNFGGARTTLRATVGNGATGDRHTMRILSLENLDR